MRILVTGSNGQLGFDCIRELKKRGYDDIIGLDINNLNITNAQHVFETIRQYKPDIIMHNAAWTAVDLAEENFKDANDVNANGTLYIAEAAEEIGAKMLYISTDYVFSGKGKKFFEVNDIPSPLSVYGQTKLNGENLAKNKCSKLFIVRTSWVFGFNGNNFVKTMLRLGEKNKEINVVCDQIGSPTYTIDLAKFLCDLVFSEKFGTYHATNEGICSWADFAKKIFELANMDVNVVPIPTKQYIKINPSQAVRPLNSRLSKKSLDEAGFARLPNWDDALLRYLKELRKI